MDRVMAKKNNIKLGPHTFEEVGKFRYLIKQNTRLTDWN